MTTSSTSTHIPDVPRIWIVPEAVDLFRLISLFFSLSLSLSLSLSQLLSFPFVLKFDSTKMIPIVSLIEHNLRSE